MTIATTLQRDQLVDEIVRRVVMRLKEGLAAENEESGGESVDFGGRLLTMESLSRLSVAGVLRVPQRCIVTPEVVDELKRQQVRLQRVACKATAPQVPTAVGLTVWEKHESGPRVHWLDHWVKQHGGNYHSSACPDALRRQLQNQATQGKHIIVTDSDWVWQQQLSEAGVFAPRLRLDDARDWEALQQTQATVVILRSPITRWQLTRLWRQWTGAGGDR